MTGRGVRFRVILERSEESRKHTMGKPKGLFIILCLASVDYQHRNNKHQTHGKGGGEDADVGHEAFRAVAVYYRFRVFKHCFADEGSDNAGDKHLREDAHALKRTCLALGGAVPYFSQ